MEKVKQNKNKTEQAETLLRTKLKEKAFDMKKADVETAWNVFKEMSFGKFDCAEDELLFEAGICDYDGKELFCISMVRQFTVIEEDGEFDYIEQLHMDFLFEPEEALKDLEKTIWSYDFDDDFNRFFEAVEKSSAFCVPKEQFTPVGFDLYFDEI